MDKRLHLLTAISALTLGAAVNSSSSVASSFAGVDLQRCEAVAGKTQAECACEAALDNGNPKVLALFFSKYAAQSKNTACAALASTAVTGAPPSTGDGSANSNGPGRGASGGG